MWQFLFDLDGTILDTTELILNSFIHTFAVGLNQVVTVEELMVHFGRPLGDQFRILRPDLTPSEVDRLVELYIEHNEREHDQWVTVVPGADLGLAALADLGYPLGLVTSKREALARHGLELFRLEQLFSTVVSFEHTTRHKPHPEPVQKALQQMPADKVHSVYVGDSPYDMASGKAAGVRTLGLVHNTFSEADLIDAGADRVVHRWQEIVAVLLEWASKPSQETHISM